MGVNKMLRTFLKTIKRFFEPMAEYDPLIEGIYADQYTDQKIKNSIAARYRQAHPEPVETPETHPWKYDPLNPPTGWRYDPYYEFWIKETL